MLLHRSGVLFSIRFHRKKSCIPRPLPRSTAQVCHPERSAPFAPRMVLRGRGTCFSPRLLRSGGLEPGAASLRICLHLHTSRRLCTVKTNNSGLSNTGEAYITGVASTFARHRLEIAKLVTTPIAASSSYPTPAAGSTTTNPTIPPRTHRLAWKDATV
jgi:hypothetical protein